MHDTLIHLDQGTAADFGHFACLVAAAAIRAGLPVDLDVPVRDGRIRLPGLGSLLVASEKAWVRLRSDGERVTAGDEFAAEARLMRPDDGTGAPAMARYRAGPAPRPSARTAAGRPGPCCWRLATGTSTATRCRCAPRCQRMRWRHWRERVRTAWQIVATGTAGWPGRWRT